MGKNKETFMNNIRNATTNIASSQYSKSPWLNANMGI